MRVLITGSTTWTDVDAIYRELKQLPAESVIVTGDTLGVDAMACEVGQLLGLRVQQMKKTKADYQRYPREAWKGLNERMLAAGIGLVLAFHAEYASPDRARGTKHAVALAEELGITVHIYTE